MMNFLRKTIILLYIACPATVSTIITPALPVIASDFSLNHTALGYIVSLFLAGYTVGFLIYAPLSHRFTCLNALRIGLVFNLLGNIIALLAAHEHMFVWLIIGRILSGFGSSACFTCGLLITHHVFNRDDVKKMMSFSVIALMLMPIIATAVGGIITTHLHWSLCFLVIIVYLAILFSFTWIFPTNFLQKESKLNIKRIANNYWNILKNKKLLTFAILMGISPSFAYAYSLMAPMVSHHILGLSPQSYGYWNVLCMAGMILSGLTSAYITRHMAPSRVLLCVFWGIILCTVILGIMNYIHILSALFFFVLSAALYFFVSFIFPVTSFHALDDVDDKETGASILAFIELSVSVMSLLLLSALPFSYFWSFVFIILFLMAVSLCILKLNRHLI